MQMAEAILGTVIRNLTTFVQGELATFLGVNEQTQKLTGYLSAIHAVLQDAEEKQITSNAVKLWLQKLSDATYVLDDILDECSIQSNLLPMHNAFLTRIHPNNILFRCKIGKRMKDIVQRFDAINEERQRFHFRSTEMGERQEDEEWRQTSSVIPEHKVYGRDRDRDQIVEFLVRQASNNEDLSIYPVVGMGGNGKTTLAQLVFNDHQVTTHFDLKIWVCVSDDFRIMRILQSIIESVDMQSSNLTTIEALQKKVQEMLQGKRYLLVLDDVWNDDQVEWGKLKSLLSCGRGTKGASILVTTRLENVTSIMGTCPAHHLCGLSEDDNWSLFKHHAFGSTMEEREELVAIGKEIVRKCVGSPLASKALGSLLCTKREEKQWLSVKESKFWDIPEENHIMRALRLSYFNLNLSSRRCFSFCAIFPKDFKIEKERLIHLWMANGFIQSRGNLDVEDVGTEVWNELYKRSFFQEVEVGMFDLTFKMHDLFHDLAQSIMGEECVIDEVANLTNLSSRVHHVQSFNPKKSISMPAFKNVESLRTFLLDGSSFLFYELPPTGPLRALSIGLRQFSTLKNLTHLRYLNILWSSITSLPESICRLQKLQILKLEHCHYLSSLPKHLTQLQDLRHLIIEDCHSLIVMPPNIGKLTCLKTLTTFIVDSKVGLGLAELHDLKLGGLLHIRGIENVNSERDAKQANLIDKKELNRLYFSWGRNANSQGGDAERIIEALQPHSNLKSVGLNGYRGIQFPSWMRNPSVVEDLVSVILHNCNNCQCLPPLGKLPHLTFLDVSGMEVVKHLDDDSYDDILSKAFKSLKRLNLHRLPNLETILRDERVEMLPLLSKLTISKVPKLKLPCLPSIEVLQSANIEDAASFSEGIVRNMPHLKSLHINNSNNLKALPDAVGSLNALEALAIQICDELECFPEHVLQGLTSLQSLFINGCKKLKSLSDGVLHLSRLQYLDIMDCPQLVSMVSNINQAPEIHLTALRRVEIRGSCQVPEGLQCIPFLECLELYDVDSLPDWIGDITSLRQLELGSSHKLRSLPSSLSQLTNLQELVIGDCPEIEKRCKRGTGEDWHKIAHVPLIQIGNRDDEEEITFCGAVKSVWNLQKEKIHDLFNKDQPHSHFDPFTAKVDGSFCCFFVELLLYTSFVMLQPELMSRVKPGGVILDLHVAADMRFLWSCGLTLILHQERCTTYKESFAAFVLGEEKG